LAAIASVTGIFAIRPFRFAEIEVNRIDPSLQLCGLPLQLACGMIAVI
jgi:hypothetical protein